MRKLSLLLFSTIGLASATAQERALATADDLRPRFERLDRNGDGAISQDEADVLPRGGAWLRQADRDKDGLTTWEELAAFLDQNASPEPDPAAPPIEVVGEFPEESPINLSSARKAAIYSEKTTGYSFLIQAAGDVIYERYTMGWDPETPHLLASGTKSFSAAILAAAVQDELITLDEPVSKSITEWQEDPKKAGITIRQLLSLTSGLDSGKVGAIPSYAAAVETTVVAKPGTRFSYGPVPFQIWGEVMRRKLSTRDDLPYPDALAYLEARIFEPIGLRYDSWKTGTDDFPRFPSGASLTAREWVKYGQWLLDNGEVEGKPVADANTLKEAFKGSKAQAAYGLTFWLLDQSDLPQLAGGYMAAGLGKQRLYILPAVDMTIVRQGDGREFEDGPFFEALFASPSEQISTP
ncbi:MAG: serine hydrolase [Verrucomicrobiota bacterium]